MDDGAYGLNTVITSSSYYYLSIDPLLIFLYRRKSTADRYTHT